jgi:hypothetical protein
MATRPPEPLSDSELIAAYLDEDLTSAELARADELLKTNPESRKLLDDLRAQRSKLAEVPRERLGDEFAQRTMRKVERALRNAEREVLIPTTPSEELVVAAASASPQQVPSPRDVKTVPASRGLRLGRGRRPLVYVAFALAAAIVLMLLPVRQGEPPTASVAHHEAFPPSEISSSNRAITDATPTESMDVDRSMPGRLTTAPAAGSGESIQPSPSSPTAATVTSSPAGVMVTSSPAASNPLTAIAGTIGNVQIPPGDDAEVRQVLTEAGLGFMCDDVLAQMYALAHEASQDNRLPILLCPGMLVVEVDVKPSQWKRKELEDALAENGVVVDAPGPLLEQDTDAATAVTALKGSIETSGGTRRALDLMCVVAPSGVVTDTIEQWKDKRDVVVQTNAPTAASSPPAAAQENQLGNRMEGRAQSLDVSKIEHSFENNLRKAEASGPKPIADTLRDEKVDGSAKKSKQSGESQATTYQRALLVIRAADEGAKDSEAAPTAPSAPAKKDE